MKFYAHFKFYFELYYVITVIKCLSLRSADLGGSSKYSREALEDRCGEGFRVNSRWTRVSRS